MINKVRAGAVAINGQLNGVVKGSSINGFVITKSIALHANDAIDVTVRSSMHDSVVSCNGIKAINLMDISNIDFGMSRVALDWAHEQGVAAGGDTAPDNTVRAFLIPLGCMHLRETDSEVEITVRSGDAASWDISTYFDTEGPDHIFVLNETQQLVSTHKNVDSVYLAADADLNTFGQKDVSSLTQVGDQQYYNSYDGLFGYNVTRKMIEIGGPGRILKAYEADGGGINESVELKLSGADAGDFTVLVRERVMIAKRVEAGQERALSKLSRAFETGDDQAVAAMIQVGTLPKARVIANAQADMRSGKAKISLQSAGRLASM